MANYDEQTSAGRQMPDQNYGNRALGGVGGISCDVAAKAASDPMRSQYRLLSSYDQSRIDTVKALGAAFLAMIGTSQGREVSIAKTKIEEAVMWAVKGITG